MMDPNADQAEVLHIKSKRRNYATNLNPHERALIEEAQRLFASAFEDESRLPLIGEILTIYDAMSIPSIYASRTVKFFRSLTPFRPLCHADQVRCIKSVYNAILAVKFAFVRDCTRDGYPILAVIIKNFLFYGV
jgi:hypothetical protein